MTLVDLRLGSILAGLTWSGLVHLNGRPLTLLSLALDHPCIVDNQRRQRQNVAVSTRGLWLVLAALIKCAKWASRWGLSAPRLNALGKSMLAYPCQGP